MSLEKKRHALVGSRALCWNPPASLIRICIFFEFACFSPETKIPKLVHSQRMSIDVLFFCCPQNMEYYLALRS
jgi:hypothetical protein